MSVILPFVDQLKHILAVVSHQRYKVMLLCGAANHYPFEWHAAGVHLAVRPLRLVLVGGAHLR